MSDQLDLAKQRSGSASPHRSRVIEHADVLQFNLEKAVVLMN